MGKPVEQALGEVDFCADDLRVLRRQGAEAAGRRADRAARRRRLGDGPPELRRRAAGDHAVELPLLPGGAVRGPEPGDRQHDPAQARAPVPGVGGRDGARSSTTPASRPTPTSTSSRPTTRSRHDRRPARRGRLGDRQRARRRGGRGDRRAQPQEGRARARRLGPVHPARAPTTSTAAVESAVAARLDNAGQACNAAKRFIVVDDLYEPFVEKFTAAMTAVEPGDPTKSGRGDRAALVGDSRPSA